MPIIRDPDSLGGLSVLIGDRSTTISAFPEARSANPTNSAATTPNPAMISGEIDVSTAASGLKYFTGIRSFSAKNSLIKGIVEPPPVRYMISGFSASHRKRASLISRLI